MSLAEQWNLTADIAKSYGEISEVKDRLTSLFLAIQSPMCVHCFQVAVISEACQLPNRKSKVKHDK